MPTSPQRELFNLTRKTILANQVEFADSFWARTRGLIGRRQISDDFALVIKPCHGIHTLFMSTTIDVAYVSREGRVVRVLHDFKPWRVGPIDWRCNWVIELSAGLARRTGLHATDLVGLVRAQSTLPERTPSDNSPHVSRKASTP
jgi:uncharacterized membrane protein (UPF0127 family)